VPDNIERASGRKQYACSPLRIKNEERTQGTCLKFKTWKQRDHHR